MLRSLLEMSIGYYLEKTGHITKLTINEKQKHKNNLPRDWHPTLRQMLSYIVNSNSNIISNGNYIKVLDRLISDKNGFLSIDTLNLFVHNQYFYPNAEDLRVFWNQLQNLFEITLVEPNLDDEPK